MPEKLNEGAADCVELYEGAVDCAELNEGAVNCAELNEEAVDCALLNEDMLGFGAVEVTVAPPPNENGPEATVGLLKPNDGEAAVVDAAVAPPKANVDTVAAAG